MKAKVIKIEEGKTGSVTLDDALFNLPWNETLVYQSLVTHRENSRQKIAHTKGTSEVRGGGRKPWRQKGTGRARHGTIRSPLWKGGGVTFGPTIEKKFGKKLNKKMKRKALFTALSKKLDEGEVIIVDSLTLPETKTKIAKNLINNLSSHTENIDKESLLFIPESKNKDFQKAVRNIKKAHAISPKSLNIYDLLSYKFIIFDKASVKEIAEHFTKNKNE